MRRFIWWTGFWPGEALGEKTYLLVKWHKVQMILQHIIAFVGQLMYIKVFFNQIPFLDVGMIYISASLTVMVIVSMYVAYEHSYNLLLVFIHKLSHACFIYCTYCMLYLLSILAVFVIILLKV